MKYWLTGIIVVLLALAAWFYFGATEEPVIDEVAPPGRAVVSYYGPEQDGIDFGPHRYRW